MKKEEQLNRLVDVTGDFLLKQSVVISTAQKEGFEYFKDSNLLMLNLKEIEYPIQVFKSLAATFKANSDEDALAKVAAMTDEQIRNVIRSQIVAQVNIALQDNWLDKALEKIIDNYAEPLVRAKEKFESDLGVENTDLIFAIRRIKETTETNRELYRFVEQWDGNEKALDFYVENSLIDEEFENYVANTVIVRVGNHAYHLSTSGSTLNDNYNKSYAFLNGRSLAQAVKEDFDLDDVEKQPSLWESCCHQIGYTFY